MKCGPCSKALSVSRGDYRALLGQGPHMSAQVRAQDAGLAAWPSGPVTDPVSVLPLALGTLGLVLGPPHPRQRGMSGSQPPSRGSDAPLSPASQSGKDAGLALPTKAAREPPLCGADLGGRPSPQDLVTSTPTGMGSQAPGRGAESCQAPCQTSLTWPLVEHEGQWTGPRPRTCHGSACSVGAAGKPIRVRPQKRGGPPSQKLSQLPGQLPVRDRQMEARGGEGPGRSRTARPQPKW